MSKTKQGELAFKKVEKVVNSGCLCCCYSYLRCAQNAELFTLTYGAIVTQLVKDCDNIPEVNEKLETM